MIPLQYIDLGRMPYLAALEVQRERLSRVQAAGESDAPLRENCLLLVEHDPPVITLGRRGKEAADLRATPEQLREMGIEVHHATRGGQATYHGPGQLVGYPILHLGALGLAVPQYVRQLEETLIRTLARFAIDGLRFKGQPGVWVEGSAGSRPEDRAELAPGAAKIAAIGVAVSRRVCYHGFALNVCTNLDHFRLIVPCGQPAGQVTSMSEALGRRVEIADVKPVLLECFGEAFGAEVVG
jgi:lipoate-protein ligase B